MDQVELHSVGEVAARVGVTPSTVRMWGQRYGLNASGRSPGGHRRFTPADVDVLERFHQAVVSGESPMAAAAALTGSPTSEAAGGGPGGAVLAVPRAGRQARGLARAASRLDEMAVEDGVLESLREQATVAVWDEVVRPLLVAAGERWQRTGTGIEIEHLLTQAISTAFIRYLSELPELPRDRPVLLAGGPHEEHILALYAVRARLAEEGIPARLLGPRTPMHALAAAAQRTRSPGVLVWMSIEDAVAEGDLILVRNAHRRLRLFVAGAGWTQSPHRDVTVTGSLDDAGAQLASSWRTRPHPGTV